MWYNVDSWWIRILNEEIASFLAMTNGMPLQEEVVLHKGTYKKTATVTEAVFMISGMTIGAGILALPYTVSQIGLLPGLAYIATLGFITLFFNLMIGEIALRTKDPMQLSGFAGKYLGKWAKFIILISSLVGAFGALLAYIIGEGAVLSSMLGGQPLMWSIIFWTAGSLVVWSGLQKIKLIDKVFGVLIVTIIAAISFYLLPHFHSVELKYFNVSKLLFPLGVILFALHASPAIAEVHALLPGAERRFRKALIIGTLLPIGLYLLFTLAVVGFSGRETTEVATVGLDSLGPLIGFFANLFAVLAMTTGFLGTGTALREMLVWDHKFPDKIALFLVISLPFSLFLLGVRSFIGVLEAIGGICLGLEGVIMAGVYLKARKGSDLIPERYFYPRYPLAISLPVFIFFGTLLVVTVYNFFK